MRTLVLTLTFALFASAAAAQEPDPDIRNLSAVANAGNVSVRFNLINAFADHDLVSALQSGLPTSFSYIVEIFHDRPKWWDEGISRTRIEVVATFNSVTREYLLSYRRDRKLVRSEAFSDLESLERRMTAIDEPNLFPIGNRRFYKLKVRVKADFGRVFLFYIFPSSNSTRWREVRVASESKP
ncbi:MAG TPA: DUF4390 domain-containing protein, partial [Thermoanaerobaculia bacterium]|nr:DUF4390 domain-containing protein [Thermoanaerobaculia bacterium]